MNHSIDVLEGLGLCVASREAGFPFARTVSLTSRGRLFLSTPVRELPSFIWTHPAPRAKKQDTGRP